MLFRSLPITTTCQQRPPFLAPEGGCCSRKKCPSNLLIAIFMYMEGLKNQKWKIFYGQTNNLWLLIENLL